MLENQTPLLSQERLLIIYFIIILLFISIFAVIFVAAFQRRKNKFLTERYEAEQKYQQELADSRIEIQEKVLKNMAWELHDNVGQLLSVVNLQLNILLRRAPDSLLNQIKETKDVIKETVYEVRSLSKVLNNEVILKNGLLETIKVEMNRLERLGYMDISLQILGRPKAIDNSEEIIIFRIVQEFLSNVIKHSKASKLFVLLEYKPNSLEITVSDNGVGFDVSAESSGSGMETMQSRAALIRASLSIISEIGKGTQLFLTYFYENERKPSDS